MGNGKNDWLGTFSNLLSNVDIGQVMSLVSSFMGQKPQRNTKMNNPASMLGNLDLGKLSEAFANLNLGEPRQNDRRPSFFNQGNQGNQGNQAQGYNGIFDIGNLQSLFSGMTDRIESLRNFRF